MYQNGSNDQSYKSTRLKLFDETNATSEHFLINHRNNQVFFNKDVNLLGVVASGISNLDGGINVDNDAFTVQTGTGNTNISGTATVDGMLMYKGGDDVYHNVEREFEFINNRVDGILVDTTDDSLNSLADIVSAFTESDRALGSDISCISHVISNIHAKQNLIRSELLKVCHFLNANHNANYMDEQMLTKVGETMLIDTNGTPQWEDVTFDKTAVQPLNSVYNISVSTYSDVHNAINISDLNQTSPVDITHGVVYFLLTAAGDHHVKVPTPSPTSRAILIKNTSSSAQSSSLRVVLGNTVKRQISSVTTSDENTLLILQPGDDLLLWARPDNCWSVISTDNHNTQLTAPMQQQSLCSTTELYEFQKNVEISMERISENESLIKAIQSQMKECPNNQNIIITLDNKIEMLIELISENKLMISAIQSQINEFAKNPKIILAMDHKIDLSMERISDTEIYIQQINSNFRKLQESVCTDITLDNLDKIRELVNENTLVIHTLSNEMSRIQEISESRRSTMSDDLYMVNEHVDTNTLLIQKLSDRVASLETLISNMSQQ